MQYKFSHTSRFHLLILTSLVIAVSIFISIVHFNTASAKGESYTYASNGQSIVGSGGLFDKPAKFTKEFGNRYVGSMLTKWDNEQCRINSAAIVVGSDNKATLTLRILHESNGTNSNTVRLCSQTVVDQLYLNNTSITIGGSKDDSTPPPKNTPDTPQEASNKQILITVYSPKKISELPNVEATITTGDLGALRKSVSWNQGIGTGSARFENVAAGRYTVCLTPSGAFNFNQCKTVTKKDGNLLQVAFGSNDNAYNEDGKKVVVTVDITMPNFTGERTYGPISLVVLDKDNKVATITTQEKKVGGDTGQVDDGAKTTLGATFDNINPGKNYKVCVEGQSICTSTFEKVNNVKKNVTLAVSKADSEKLIGNSGDESSCRIDGIGWIICPVMNFMAGIVDAAYSWVASLLMVPPLSTSTSSDNATYQSWSIMRSIANVAFVIAFLIIIFSQLTSVGVNNYNIKKLLPRIVIAAILVNVSYWICAIAVDVSNILGNSMFHLLNSGVGDQIKMSTEWSNSAAGNWTDLAGWAVAGGVAIGGISLLGPSILLPALVAALLAIVTVFIVLTLRQALIIILIFIAPLAFVAYLLPNTESLFKKWRQLLQTLLLMYPIIAIIFGASAVASKVVMASNPTFSVQVMGALITILPLAITPVVMKTAGGLLNRFGGSINNPTKGPFDRMKRGAENVRKREQNRMNNKSFNGKAFGGKLNPRGAWQRRSARINAIDENQQRELSRSKTDMIAEDTKSNKKSVIQAARGVIPGVSSNGLRDQMTAGSADADGASNRALGSAISVQAKLEAEEISAASAVIQDLHLSVPQINEIAKGGEAGGISGNDEMLRTAALQHAVKIGTVADVEDIIKSSGTMSPSQRSALSSAVIGSGVTGKATHLAGKTLGDIEAGNITSDQDLDNVMIRAAENGKYSSDNMVTNDPVSLARMQKLMSNGSLSSATTNNLQASADNILTDERLKTRVLSGQKPILEQMQNHTNVPSAPAPTPNSPPVAAQTPNTPQVSAPQVAYSPQPVPVNSTPQTTAKQSSGTNPTTLTIPHNTPGNNKPIKTPPSTATDVNSTSYTTQNITVNNNQTVNESGIRSVPLSGRRSSAGQYTNPTQPIPKTTTSRTDYLPPQTPNSDPTNIPPEFFK